MQHKLERIFDVHVYEVDEDYIVIDDGAGYSLVHRDDVDACLDGNTDFSNNADDWTSFCQEVDSIIDTHNSPRRDFVAAVCEICELEAQYWTDLFESAGCL